MWRQTLRPVVAASLVAFSWVVCAQPATNDPKATATNGLFSLPDLDNADHYYVIEIVAPDEAKKRAPIVLPKGVSAFKLSPGVMPKGAWSWRYERSPLSLAAIEPIEPKQGVIPNGDLVGEETPYIAFRWRTVPGATKYKLTYTSTTLGEERRGPAPKPTSVEVDLALILEETNQTEIAGTTIKSNPGTSVTWKVEGFNAAGIKLAESAEVQSSIEAPVYARAKARGWSLQRSDTIDKENKAQAATFGYARSSTEGKERDAAYQTEFALIWQGKQFDDTFLDGYVFPRFSLEARLHSSGEKKKSDAIRARYGVMLLHRNAETTLNLKYETDAKVETKKGLVELIVYPTMGPFWRYLGGAEKTKDMFYNYRRGTTPGVQFMVGPSVGIEVGKTFEAGTSTETEDTIVRYVGNLRTDLELNFLSRALGLPRVSAFGQATYRYLPREDTERSNHYAATGLEFFLTPGLSLSLRYSVGKDSPTFLWTRSANASIGVKF